MSSEAPENPQSVYDFKVKDTYGNDVSLDKYKGKVLLIVNIASQCGLTNTNYKELTELSDKYKDQGKISQKQCKQILINSSKTHLFCFRCENIVIPLQSVCK